MPQIRRSVAGIVINKEQLFIAQRKGAGALADKWEFPGGKAEEGESNEEALRREFLEEFGIGVEVGSLIADSSFEHNGKNFLLYAYRVFLSGILNLKELNLAEHSRWRWASIAEIKEIDFVPSDLALLPALKNYLDRQAVVE
ncbi:MAG: NUDIX domain-containing protein [Treponema sp.]|nr:NUDIX domain-containing protein [Treponema sp.]